MEVQVSNKKSPAFYHPETGELLQGLQRSLLSNDGRLEYPDPVPMEPTVSRLAPAAHGMRQLVQELIREEMSQLADAMEMETFEEADDFDIEDDPLDPQTPYEKVFDPAENEKLAAARKGDAPKPAEPVPPPGEEAVASPGSPLPAKPTAVTNGGPNVKRSESDVSRPSERPAGHPSGPGAHSSERAP